MEKRLGREKSSRGQEADYIRLATSIRSRANVFFLCMDLTFYKQYY